LPTHDRFDLHRWIAEFPLSRLRGEAGEFVRRRRRELPGNYADEDAVQDHIELMSPKADIAVGPRSVAVNEQLRAEIAAQSPYPGRRVATDVVVWAHGEATVRAATKVGGLPYRSASAPWPADANGSSRFVAQLNFADSADIVPRLPGDILLIFGDDDALLAEPERLVFEWVRLGVEDLVQEVPSRDDLLAPFHAVLHRTDDWSDEWDRTDDGAEDLRLWEGTKFGGVPKFIQDDDAPDGRFIAALGSISVPVDERFPFVNVAEPRGWSRENDLMIGDMGSLYLFLQRDGTVAALPQCY
jgi:hypothetical protein